LRGLISNLDLTRRSLRRIEERQPDMPLLCTSAPPPEAWTPQGQNGLDDKTLAYVLAARPAFDLLRDAAGQLAALLVLAAAGGRSAQDNPVFALARQAQAEARDLIASLRPGRRGAHHHRHLRACMDALGGACDEASQTMHKEGQEGALTLLHEGLRQLHFAAGALPGFEVVAFNQACCAAHGFVGPALEEKLDG
jgi:hypothetical protein